MPKADLVLEGGGVKGVGLVGAVLRLMREGYGFPRVAGTSAGALVAAFLAAGIDRDGLFDVMERLDYGRVSDRAPPGIPALSEGMSLLWAAGAYEGDYIHDFLERELAALGVRTFADLRRTDAGADGNLAPASATSSWRWRRTSATGACCACPGTTRCSGSTRTSSESPTRGLAGRRSASRSSPSCRRAIRSSSR